MDRTGRILRSAFLSRDDLVFLLSVEKPGDIARLREAACDLTTRLLGNRVHFRGIVEFSNACARNCLYCGLRRGNRAVTRYTLSRDEIVEAALWCADAGYGSCVLQSGERRDRRFIALVEDCVRAIKEKSRRPGLPDGLGITLSVGEQRPETYRRFFAAGAHRYLLRIETSNPALFRRIHPPGQRFEDRLACLRVLRETGFQVGTGVMIGLPGQTAADLADDIRFMAGLDVDMVGMGPYLVHRQAPMGRLGMTAPAELLRLGLKMIAVTRLALRDINIAATTALQALAPDGREQGLTFGANIVMPNATPRAAREHYLIYEGKPCLDETRDECRFCLERRVAAAGREIGWNEWGDSRHFRARANPPAP